MARACPEGRPPPPEAASEIFSPLFFPAARRGARTGRRSSYQFSPRRLRGADGKTGNLSMYLSCFPVAADGPPGPSLPPANLSELLRSLPRAPPARVSVARIEILRTGRPRSVARGLRARVRDVRTGRPRSGAGHLSMLATHRSYVIGRPSPVNGQSPSTITSTSTTGHRSPVTGHLARTYSTRSYRPPEAGARRMRISETRPRTCRSEGTRSSMNRGSYSSGGLSARPRSRRN